MFSTEVAEARRINAARKQGNADGEHMSGPDQFGKDENMTVTIDEGLTDKKKLGRCVKKFKAFDLHYLKPFLIHNF